MKIFLALVISVLASSAFAQVDNIQVNVNGRIYQCSGDGGQNDETKCCVTTDAAVSKFEACKKTGKYAPDCFSSAFGKQTLQSCTYWSETCNKTCKSVGLYAPDCYAQCYE